MTGSVSNALSGNGAGLSADGENAPAQVALRGADEIMRLSRMGSFFPTRLSFLRSLLRKLADDGVRVQRTEQKWDDNGYGHCVLEVVLDGHAYSLIAYTAPLDASQRTDRVIAEAWDACFVLFDGRPTSEEIAELRDHTLVQEAGRYHNRVLILSRANKSMRLFHHVVERLAEGLQPDAEMIGRIGYLMRTTAVYGNGKFGLADRTDIVERPTLSQPFRLEMLTVFLIREFTIDLVNHVARAKGQDNAAQLSPSVARRLGIGNSTGLGMAPFLISHPILINNWMLVRETAIARVRACENVDAERLDRARSLMKQIARHLEEWNVDDEPEQERIESLRREWAGFADQAHAELASPFAWNRLIEISRSGSEDLQELVVSLVLEPNGDLVDGLCECMEQSHDHALDPTLTIKSLRAMIKEHYQWALDLDLSSSSARERVWYVSEEKLEPRFGDAVVTDQYHQSMPHDIAHKVQALWQDVENLDDNALIAELLLKHPVHRDMVHRVQMIDHHPYGEVRDNLVDGKVRPIDLLRCKLSFFGASKFDPLSDRWTRITLYQGAPMADELTVENTDHVFLPALGPSV